MSTEPTTHETVRVSDVAIPDDHREVDQETVSRLAESIRANGLLHPIVVRHRKTLSGLGKVTTTGIVLVAGAHRLKATELAGLKDISAIFLKGDDSHARLVAIEENLCRKDLTVLERSDQLAEWMRITKQLEVSGHDVRKPAGGRPEGGNAKLARKWPISGRTEEASRKAMARADKISQLSPAVRAAVKEAHLDDNQSGLLAIAKETTPQAQITKVVQLATPGMVRKATKKAMPKKPLSADDKKYLAGLVTKWNDDHELKRAFIKASPNVREKFIAKIKRDGLRDPAKGWGK